MNDTLVIAPWDRPWRFDGEPWKDGLVYYGCDGPGSTWWVVPAGTEHAHPFWRITEKHRA